jgi:biopolymer transport protein ExbB
MIGTGYPLVEYFKAGGPVMWLLLACSVAGLGIILYKAWQFLTISGNVDPVLSRVEKCVKGGDQKGASQACASLRGPVAAVVQTGLERTGQTKAAIREAVADVGNHQLASLESFLPALQTVGNVAPLLGFLGTVLGMIQAFFAISQAGLGDPGVVANGIAQALITTATGLIVAVPAFVFYNYFVARVNGFALQIERAASHVVNLVAADGGAW